MADDNPFGKEGKTVIRPNPGGAFGRKMPPEVKASPAPMPPSIPSDLKSANVQGGWTDTSQPKQSGVSSQKSSPNDDWMNADQGKSAFFPDQQSQKTEQSVPSSKIPLDVALASLNYDMKGPNPITSSAGPLLVLLGRLRLMIVDMHALPLMEHVANEIMRVDGEIRQNGISSHDADVVKYILSGTADDIVQNLPGTDRHTWLQYSMLARFFQVRTSGVGFYEELDKVLQNPAQRYDLLELIYMCLSVGFEGQYRGSGGEVELSRVRIGVYQALRNVKPRNQEDISPRWRGVAVAMNDFRDKFPLWTIGGISAAVLLGFFVLFRVLLGTENASVSDNLIALHPTKQVSIERNAFVAHVNPNLGQTKQLDRIRGVLDDEIKKNLLKVESVGEYIILQVNNLILFPSGSATVKKKFRPVAGRIVEALNPERGPILVIGHTDNVKLRGTGRFKSNFGLSVARAKGVAKMLTRGLEDSSRLDVGGKGELSPIASNKTRKGRALNRRVEIMIKREETL